MKDCSARMIWRLASSEKSTEPNNRTSGLRGIEGSIAWRQDETIIMLVIIQGAFDEVVTGSFWLATLIVGVGNVKFCC